MVDFNIFFSERQAISYMEEAKMICKSGAWMKDRIPAYRPMEKNPYEQACESRMNEIFTQRQKNNSLQLRGTCGSLLNNVYLSDKSATVGYYKQHDSTYSQNQNGFAPDSTPGVSSYFQGLMPVPAMSLPAFAPSHDVPTVVPAPDSVCGSDSDYYTAGSLSPETMSPASLRGGSFSPPRTPPEHSTDTSTQFTNLSELHNQTKSMELSLNVTLKSNNDYNPSFNKFISHKYDDTIYAPERVALVRRRRSVEIVNDVLGQGGTLDGPDTIELLNAIHI